MKSIFLIVLCVVLFGALVFYPKQLWALVVGIVSIPYGVVWELRLRSLRKKMDRDPEIGKHMVIWVDRFFPYLDPRPHSLRDIRTTPSTLQLWGGRTLEVTTYRRIQFEGSADQ